MQNLSGGGILRCRLPWSRRRRDKRKAAKNWSRDVVALGHVAPRWLGASVATGVFRKRDVATDAPVIAVVVRAAGRAVARRWGPRQRPRARQPMPAFKAIVPGMGAVEVAADQTRAIDPVRQLAAGRALAATVVQQHRQHGRHRRRRRRGVCRREVHEHRGGYGVGVVTGVHGSVEVLANTGAWGKQVPVWHWSAAASAPTGVCAPPAATPFAVPVTTLAAAAALGSSRRAAPTGASTRVATSRPTRRPANIVAGGCGLGRWGTAALRVVLGEGLARRQRCLAEAALPRWHSESMATTTVGELARPPARKATTNPFEEHGTVRVGKQTHYKTMARFVWSSPYIE